MNIDLSRRAVMALAAMLSACAAATAPSAPAPAAPTFILLGEVHDNADHHRARAEQLRRLIAQEPRTAVVFEQFSRAQDAAVAQARRSSPADLDTTLTAAQFDRKAWRWPLHQPLFDVSLPTGAELRGGNLDREQVRRIVREGDAAWPADLLALRDRTPWDAAQQASLRKDIQDGHCGAMPEAMLPGMVQAQRARDAAMAQAMLQARAQGAKQVVLIAGNGHVRRDVAVPVYLRAAGVTASDIDAVGYLEPGSAAPDDQYDRVERAPAPSREDPCAAFKR
ncbi:MAG: ChaN family lipoprotein [Burkholderiaceae bacterium]